MFRDASGATVTIRKKLGEGGEGVVFAISERSDVVAKIYSKPLSDRQVAKLEQMVFVGDDTLGSVAAWPTGMLYKGARPVGFTMPLLTSQHPLHDLFGPKQRQTLFPNAHWKFLVHTGINLARAFEVLHERSIVVGDVNSNNVVVYGDSTARLIDCDSFQIQNNGTVFRCNVGVAEYQPPELQGRDFSQIDRLPQHDLFGLAVMIFQLLFVGKHPFAGVLPANMRGNAAIGANVAARRYFYAAECRRLGLAPPPGSLALTAITPEMSQLFRSAFLGDPAHRPNAAMWRTALGELKNKIVACRASPAHHYRRGTACPWCALEGGGLYYFNSADATGALDDSIWKRVSDADIERVWSEIAAVRPPPPQGNPKIVRTRTYAKAPLNLYTKRRRIAYAAGAVTLLVAMAVVCFIHHPVFAIYLAFAGLLAAFGFRPDARAVADRAWKRRDRARRTFRAAEEAWIQNARNERFTQELERLQQAKRRLVGQRARYDAELTGLRRNRQKKEREAFLERHQIVRSNIPDVNPHTHALLLTFGIETAADVTQARLDGVPGLGTGAKFYLMNWRQAVEQRFRYDPKKALDPQVLSDLKRRHLRERSDTWGALVGGTAALRRIVTEIEGRRAALEREARARAEEMWQAEADADISPLLYWTIFV
ncbi:MAG: hypothetical protein WCE44_03935 [Candidatus Velthaea sp.]|jgi:DNA-binding helix-hairpin-helix protein with protein kinase domain